MNESGNRTVYSRLAATCVPNGELVHVWPLEGGVSAQVTAMEVAGPDGVLHKLVVRQHGEIDRAANPHIARDEHRLLGLLWGQGLAVAKPVFVDPNADFFALPCMVVEYLEGDTDYEASDMNGYLVQMSGHMVRVHSITCQDHDLSFLPSMADLVATSLKDSDWSREIESVDGIAKALEVLRSTPRPNRSEGDVLLHRDFWPGNVITQEGRITGIIDWEDAATGDPLCDVANSRLEMLWAFDRDAMDQFTENYGKTTGHGMAGLSWWDLYAALRRSTAFVDGWVVGYPEEPLMRADLKYFVDEAAARF